jgi:ABC-type multidrug transport system permease subunit
LQGVLVAPVPRWAMMFGKVLGGAAIAMLQALVFLALAWLTDMIGWVDVMSPTLFGLVAAVVLMFVMAIALTALGFLIAWRIDSTQGFHAIMMAFLIPMWLLSGAFFSLDVGGLVGAIVRVNPLTYGVAGLRHFLQNGGTDVTLLPGVLTCWLVSLAFAAVMLVAAWYVAGSRSTADLV